MTAETIDVLDTRTNNIGDFLQFDVIQNLMRIRGNRIHTVRDPQKAKSGKLICYGSVLRPRFFESFKDVDVSISLLGAGVYMSSFHPELSKASMEILPSLKFDYIGVRGPVTKQTLQLDNTVVMGDIAYKNEYPHREIGDIDTVVISLPPQSFPLDSYEQFLKGVSSYFPSAKRVIAVDNGYSGGYLSAAMIDRLECEYMRVDSLVALRDISDKTDIHVGFRLHQHILSLSRGTPSFLVYYDSRGLDNKLAFDLRYDVEYSDKWEDKIFKNVTECQNNNFSFFQNVTLRI